MSQINSNKITLKRVGAFFGIILAVASVIIGIIEITTVKLEIEYTLSDSGLVILEGEVKNIGSGPSYRNNHWIWRIKRGDKVIYETDSSIGDTYNLKIPKYQLGYGEFLVQAEYPLEDVKNYTFIYLDPPTNLPIILNDGDLFKGPKSIINIDLSGGIKLTLADNEMYELKYWQVQDERKQESESELIRKFNPNISKIVISAVGILRGTSFPVSNELTFINTESSRDSVFRQPAETVSDIVDNNNGQQPADSGRDVASLSELETVNNDRLSVLFTQYANSTSEDEFYQHEIDILSIVTSKDIPVEGYYSLLDFLIRVKMSYTSPIKVNVTDFETTRSNRVTAITKLEIIEL